MTTYYCAQWDISTVWIKNCGFSRNKWGVLWHPNLYTKLVIVFQLRKNSLGNERHDVLGIIFSQSYLWNCVLLICWKWNPRHDAAFLLEGDIRHTWPWFSNLFRNVMCFNFRAPYLAKVQIRPNNRSFLLFASTSVLQTTHVVLFSLNKLPLITSLLLGWLIVSPCDLIKPNYLNVHG